MTAKLGVLPKKAAKRKKLCKKKSVHYANGRRATTANYVYSNFGALLALY